MSTALAGPSVTAPSRSCPSSASFKKGGNRFKAWWQHRRTHWAVPTTTIYRVTDLLHDGHTVQVPCSEIVTTVSAWLAELGADSPLVEDLARAVEVGDWPAAYDLGERLSVEVTFAGVAA